METKPIDNLYVFGACVEPMELSDGTWRWVVTDFVFEPEIYDDEGTPPVSYTHLTLPTIYSV